jgi:hypothetical protein
MWALRARINSVQSSSQRIEVHLDTFTIENPLIDSDCANSSESNAIEAKRARARMAFPPPPPPGAPDSDYPHQRSYNPDTSRDPRYRDSNSRHSKRKRVHFSPSPSPSSVDSDQDAFRPSDLTLRLTLGPSERPTMVLKIMMFFERGRLPRIRVKTKKPRERAGRRRRSPRAGTNDRRGGYDGRERK